MNDTPNPPVATPEPPALTSLHSSFLKSLELTVKPENPNEFGAPTPDTGVEVPSTIENFGDGDSLAERVAKMVKEGINNPTETPPAVTPPPAAVTPPPAAVTPPSPAVTPPPAAVTPPPTETPKFKMPEMPKPIEHDSVLPPPPSNLDLSGLDEDDVEEVQTALFAERQYPQRYPGHAKRVLEFIRKHKQFVREQEAEDPNVSFDSNNAAYQKFIQANRPAISNAERKRLEREKLMEEAAALAERKLSAKTKRLEDEVTQLKATPIVERTINDYKSMVKELMPKEDDPIVVEAVTVMTSKAVEAGREFMLLSSSLKPYDAKSDTHRWLADFIQEQGDLYMKSGHESLKRGQRKFVPRAQYNSLPSEERNKHFTFTDEDILQLIAVNAKAAAEYHSTNEKERLKKAGYTRVTSTPPPSPTPSAPAPSPGDVSARATPTVSGGAPISDGRPTDPFLRFLHTR